MITRITIVSGKDGSPIPKVTPEQIFQAHPLWARDIERFGPWNNVEDECRTYSTWLSGARAGRPIAICGSCLSSLDVAWRLNSLEDLPEWGSVLAVEQHTGRGQVRREWVSPPGNLYGAIKWPALATGAPGEFRPVWARILPLIVGYLACRALKDIGVETQLKWPNDLLKDGKKIGGILIEERESSIMVGIGLNTASAPERDQLRPDHAVSAASINTAGVQLGPLETWIHFVDYFKSQFDSILSMQEPEEFLNILADQLVWFGEEVRIVDGPKDITTGRICGLSADGGLIVEKDGAEHTVYSGSVMPL